MKRIGLLSDTHSWWDDRYLIHFADCDEIWHAGDIGSELVIKQLEARCPVRAVCGNIDGQEIRSRFSEVLKFKVEECNVIMTHIGGYPGKYSPAIRGSIYRERPQLFIAPIRLRLVAPRRCRRIRSNRQPKGLPYMQESL